jgi:hypothetical protein
MTGDDWIDARQVLEDIVNDIGPRLSQLRNNASERFDEHTRHPDFERMRTGEILFPDERAREEEVPIELPEPSMVTEDIPELDAPNVKRGAELVAKYGGVDQALMVVQPDSAEADDIKAWVYVTTGKRPPHWIPPIV